MQSWNFISSVTFQRHCCHQRCQLISQTLLDASTGWRITSVPGSTQPSLPLLGYPHSLLSVYLWLCGMVREFLYLSVSQTVGRDACQDPQNLISGHTFLQNTQPPISLQHWDYPKDNTVAQCAISQSTEKELYLVLSSSYFKADVSVISANGWHV